MIHYAISRYGRTPTHGVCHDLRSMRFADLVLRLYVLANHLPVRVYSTILLRSVFVSIPELSYWHSNHVSQSGIRNPSTVVYRTQLVAQLEVN